MRVCDYSVGAAVGVVDQKALSRLHKVGSLCNAAKFDEETVRLPVDERRIFGDATDQAILRFAESLSSTTEVRRKWKIVHEISFNSKNKYMVRLMQEGNSSSQGCKRAKYAMRVISYVML